jgi:hypothetical protein
MGVSAEWAAEYPAHLIIKEKYTTSEWVYRLSGRQAKLAIYIDNVLIKKI